MPTVNTIDQKTKERFWSKVDIRGQRDCWFWKAGCFTKGYGAFRITVAKGQYRQEKAHRFCYILLFGLPPKDKPFVLHACDNMHCVNPAHLYAGTHSNNMQDMTSRNRSLKGKKNPNNKLTEKQVLKIRDLYSKGKQPTELGRLFNVSRMTIYQVVTKSTWTHI